MYRCFKCWAGLVGTTYCYSVFLPYIAIAGKLFFISPPHSSKSAPWCDSTAVQSPIRIVGIGGFSLLMEITPRRKGIRFVG